MERIFYFIKKVIPRRLFLILRPIYHFLLAFFAALFYGFPSRRLIVIGITGTQGKTTVVELIHEILAHTGARVASLSSLRFRIGDEETLNLKKMTMPGRFFIQRFLRASVRKGCRYAVLEVTSEGIKQFRHRFIKFDAAVFTNITPEHIEAHGSFEKYLRAKLDLFGRLSREGRAVINRDDPQYQRFSAATSAYKIFYSKEAIELGEEKYPVRDLQISHQGISFELGGVAFSSSLLGEFNFYNILAAIAAGLTQHLSLEKIALAMGRISAIPGRMEFIQEEPFAVVVDYAHTPDSLKNVYMFLKENSKFKIQNSKLICVLGAAGGGRDKWKRPEFGKIAAEFCKKIILTNEDPYDENPADIIDQIESGFPQIQNSKFKIHRKILDRREAIREALKSASPGDMVIITGKGAEPWIMGPQGQKMPWDDRCAAREELENYRKSEFRKKTSRQYSRD